MALMMLGGHQSQALLLLALFGASVLARADQSKTHCFAIHLAKAGKAIGGPEAVTFLNQSSKQSVEPSEGRFCVPGQMTDQPSLDISFILGKERFYFPRIPMEKFGASWDVSFGNKKQLRSAELPKDSRPKQACAVVFEQGEPEVGIIFSPCRVPSTVALK